MEIKSVTEQQDAIQLQIEGTLSIQKDTIRQWYNEYCVDEEPQPESGKPLYKKGLISDIHMDYEDTHKSEYREDLQNALDYFAKNGADSVESCGDFSQSCDEDYPLFSDVYKNCSLTLHTCIGNHDHLRIYHKRKSGDKTQAQCEQMWQDNIARFQGSNLHYLGSTYKEKLSYWYEERGDIYVFISIDYGHSDGTIWDDVIRGWNLLDYNSSYVKQMTEYAKDTLYNRSREKNFDYQFYNPKPLIWLKTFIEANPKKRIFLFMHHFMPNMAGDVFNVYKHLRIWPYPTSDAIRKKFYSGSNTVCGLTFWFLDKLLASHQNVIFFSGHSHYGWKEQEDKITRNYMVSQPTGNEVTPIVDDLNSLTDTQYDYHLYEPAEHSIGPCATSIHLPSLSKPNTRAGKALYGSSEGGLMEVYEDKVVIQCIRFKTEGSGKYTNEVIKIITVDVANDNAPVVEPEIPVDPEPEFKGIKIVFNNQTGQDIRFSGKFLPYSQEDTSAMPFYLCPPDTIDDYCHWTVNGYTFKVGEKRTFEFTELNEYSANKGKLTTKKIALSTIYGKHFRIADSAEWPSGISAIKVGVRTYDRSSDSSSTSSGIIHAIPITESNCLIKEGGAYEIVLDKVKDNATTDKSWLDKTYSSSDKYKYVIL